LTQKRTGEIMSHRFKKLLLLIAALLFLFALLRISTSSYENYIRSLPS